MRNHGRWQKEHLYDAVDEVLSEPGAGMPELFATICECVGITEDLILEIRQHQSQEIQEASVAMARLWVAGNE